MDAVISEEKDAYELWQYGAGERTVGQRLDTALAAQSTLLSCEELKALRAGEAAPVAW